MRLARKTTLLFELIVVPMVAAYSYFEISDESRVVRADLRSDLEATAHVGAALLSKLGCVEASTLLPSAGEYQVRCIDIAGAPGSGDGPAIADLEVGQLRPDTEHVVERSERMYVYRAFRDDRGQTAAIEVSHTTAHIGQAVARATVAAIAVSALIVVIGTLYSLTVGARLFVRPTARLIEQFRRVAAGDLTPIAGRLRKDELGALASELDVMIGRLADARARSEDDHAARMAAVEQLRHADRLTTVGMLAAGMAHELGTPLNVIAGYAKLIATGQETGAGAADSARIIGEQTQRMVELVRQLLDFSRRGELKRSVADVRPSIARALEVVSISASKAHVRLRYLEPAQPLHATIDEAKLQQVVVNLVINAIQASTSGSDVELVLTRASAAPPGGGSAQDCVRLDIVDHGKGIPVEQLKRVFEPFFTTKPVGEGTGLGLAVSHGIIEEHHGWIGVTSELGRGSRFSVFLPEARLAA